MRDLLEVNGVYVGKRSGSKIAENFHSVVPRYMCDDDGDIEQPKGLKTDLHFNEQGDLVTDDGNDSPASLQQQFTPRGFLPTTSSSVTNHSKYFKSTGHCGQ
ncbi:hypothetical protein E4U17_002930 [Claviceps sp. LM77 group G4]|nr:hypothetical protein E4U17_002930 [Claviceps sp. LM77 group G4]KAG6073602.1 hypothetical protein E4U33_002817 [Claviceps sp. LM78 group G4]KAG6081102.1 hypothetical protein E4U16_007791 [Claviceps sp. LM84 group G4]